MIRQCVGRVIERSVATFHRQGFTLRVETWLPSRKKLHPLNCTSSVSPTPTPRVVATEDVITTSLLGKVKTRLRRRRHVCGIR